MTSHRYATCLVTASRPWVLRISLAAVLASCLVASAEDWPQWRGPNRTGISTEKGWLSQWTGGPKKLWEASVGIGYSSCSVSQGRVYTMGNVKETDTIFAFDAETGKPLWKHEYACNSKDPNGYHGTRSTPTVDGNRVYTVSREGHFFCLDAATGKVIWSSDLKKDFAGVVPRWGFSGSPLIEKDWVLTETGGKGASMVAFDKATGKVAWKNGDDGAGYSSQIAFDLDGERCFPQFSADQIIGRRMKDGSELWRASWKTSYGVNAATPIIDGNKLFISSGYNFGCALLEMTPTAVKEVWRNKAMRNHVNSCILWQGHLYGFDDNTLKCLDFATGQEKWAEPKFGKGSLMLADGKFIIYSQRGLLAVAEASSSGYKELASAQILEGKDTWAAPVLANGRIYCRSLEQFVALDVKGK